jgi:hypothetical protein
MLRMWRLFATSVLLASVVATGMVAAGADTTAPTGSPLVLRHAPIYMSRNTTYTADQAVALARNNDVILAKKETFAPYVPAMRSANARLRLFAYANGTFAQKDQGTAYPDSWYLRDASGAKVISKPSSSYLMNPSIQGWVDDVTARCADFVSRSGYDGCFLDNLGVGVLSSSFVSAVPINPATSAAWTAREWQDATLAIAKAVRAGVPNAPISFNGLNDGLRYFDPSVPSSQLLSGAPLGMAETWLRDPVTGAGNYKKEKTWRKDIDMVADAEKRGGAVLAVTKLWVTATAAQQAAWHKYALASFLLATGGKSYFNFIPDTAPGSVGADHPWDHVDVGSPKAAYAKVGTVYRRQFTKGLAFVNPTTATVTVDLGGTYKTLDGATVTSVTLGPNSGEVLTS